MPAEQKHYFNSIIFLLKRRTYQIKEFNDNDFNDIIDWLKHFPEDYAGRAKTLFHDIIKFYSNELFYNIGILW
jgi:hypothetical protein